MDFISTRRDAARARLGSDLVRAPGWARISGLLPIDLDNGCMPLPGGIEGQAAKVLANLEILLKAADMAKENVAAVRISLVDFPRLVEGINAVYAGFFASDRLPARSCIGVTALTRGALVEMDFELREA